VLRGEASYVLFIPAGDVARAQCLIRRLVHGVANKGVAPEIADQLFQPFVTTKSQGMGVGLSISRTIIESHGGSITQRRNPGGGTISASRYLR
jgi:nitrogen-specific signal transduction histidine kinase